MEDGTRERAKGAADWRRAECGLGRGARRQGEERGWGKDEGRRQWRGVEWDGSEGQWAGETGAGGGLAQRERGAGAGESEGRRRRGADADADAA